MSIISWKIENTVQEILGKNESIGGFPIKIETKISLIISYSFAIFVVQK